MKNSNIVKKFIAILLILYATITCSDSNIPESESNSPFLEDNKKVAEFGLLVASQSLSYPKSVVRKNGEAIVSVVVINKLCHVTVDESDSKLKATKIACEEGNYKNE